MDNLICLIWTVLGLDTHHNYLYELFKIDSQRMAFLVCSGVGLSLRCNAETFVVRFGLLNQALGHRK